jgi:hypothetical protein
MRIIRDSTSLAALARLLEHSGDAMNQVHLTAFITQLRRVAEARRMTCSAWHRPRSDPGAQTDTDSSNDAASSDTGAMWAPEPDLDDEPAAAVTIAPGTQQQGSNRGPASQRRAGRFQRVSVQQALLDATCRRVVARLQAQIFELDARGLVTVLFALAKLRVRHHAAAHRSGSTGDCWFV